MLRHFPFLSFLNILKRNEDCKPFLQMYEFYANGLMVPPHYLKIIELTNIRRQDQNIISDTGARCLVYVCEVWSVRTRLWTSIVWLRHIEELHLILMIWWRWRFWGRGRQGKCLRFLRGKVCQLRARGLQGTFSLHAIQRANSPRPC